MNQVATPVAPTIVPEKKRDVSAISNALGLAEAKRRDFVLNVPEDHLRSDLLDPAYWAHVSRELSAFDRIEARSETGEWFCELVVVSAGRNYAVMRELSFFDMTGSVTEPPVESKHMVMLRGPKKFCVVRISDKAIISEGHSSRIEAEMSLIQYENRIAAS